MTSFHEHLHQIFCHLLWENAQKNEPFSVKKKSAFFGLDSWETTPCPYLKALVAKNMLQVNMKPLGPVIIHCLNNYPPLTKKNGGSYHLPCKLSQNRYFPLGLSN